MKCAFKSKKQKFVTHIVQETARKERGENSLFNLLYFRTHNLFLNVILHKEKNTLTALHGVREKNMYC